jgi:hypothetical protein
VRPWSSQQALRRKNTHNLSFEQRRVLIHRTIEFVDGRVPVMVGISHSSFKTAIELAHEAEKLGAAAVQLLAPLRPFAGPPSQADLIAYFEAIGRETGLLRRTREIALRSTHQREHTRSRPSVAVDRRDRPRQSRPLLHHNADAARHATTGRLRCNHAAPRLGNRAACHRCLPCKRLRARGGNSASVRTISIEINAPRACADHEGCDEFDRAACRRTLPALCPAQSR